MRIAAILMSLLFTGCSQRESVAVPAIEVGVQPEEAVRHEPIPDARRKWHGEDKDPVLSGLARNEIRVGNPIEPLIKIHKHYEVLRHGEFVILHYDPSGFGGTLMTAKNGKLIFASTSSCKYRDVFFDTMTERDRTARDEGYAHELQKRNNLRLALPAAVGVFGSYPWWYNLLQLR